MKKLILVLGILLAGCSNDPKPATSEKECPVIDVKFSPNGGAEDAIVAAINGAQTSIYVQAYSFTATNIAAALVKAKERGVDVVVIADKETTGNPNSVIKFLHQNDIEIHIDKKHAIAHSKVMIIDRRVVITGSYNFSKGANLSNSENSLTITDAKLADIYYQNWLLHKEHSSLYLE